MSPAPAAPRLSVMVITKNEAGQIEACLESTRFADEWIVVDSGSSDDTVALARAWGAQVLQTPDWPGFGPQKNRALALCRGDWVLSLDADERLTPELAAEIRRVIAQPTHAVYSFPRLSSFCGQFMRHGGWYPDRVDRLFKRGAARFSDDLVHERLRPDAPDAPVGKLRADLLHQTYPDLETMLAKMNHYSSAGAASAHARGRRAGLLTALLHAGWAFWRSYVFRLGFLDGRLGLVLAFSIAHGTLYRYLKLWRLGPRR